jgi:hypothetical protein
MTGGMPLYLIGKTLPNQGKMFDETIGFTDFYTQS